MEEWMLQMDAEWHAENGTAGGLCLESAADEVCAALDELSEIGDDDDVSALY